MIQRVFGKILNVSFSTRFPNLRHLRITGHPNKQFTIYTNHPSFLDITRLPKGNIATLVIRGNVVCDFYCASEETTPLRIFLTEVGVLSGSQNDRHRVKVLYTKLANAFPNADVVLKLREYPYYALCISGRDRLYDFDKADEISMMLGQSLQKRCRGHCHYRLKDVCEKHGHTCMPYSTYRSMINGFPGSLVKQQLDVLIQHGSIVCHNGFVFTSDTFRRESAVRDFLTSPHSPIPLRENDLVSPSLTTEQEAVFDLVQCRRIGVLTGGAGTGKTRCIAALMCAFEGVVLLAPTGKAARRIQQVCQEFNPKARSSTIHSLLGVGLPTAVRKGIQQGLPENVLIIIDEASMLDLDMAFEITQTAKHLNWAILFVGDTNQLSPVGRGNVFCDLVEWANNNGACLHLNQIHRQAQGNPIINLADHLAKSETFTYNFENSDNVQFYETHAYADAIEKAVSLYKLFNETDGWSSSQIITPWKRAAASVNQLCIGKERRIYSFEAFDYVMCTRNVAASELQEFQKSQDFIQFPTTESPDIIDRIRRSGKVIETVGQYMVTDTATNVVPGVNGQTGLLLTQNILIDEDGCFVFIGNDKTHANAITIHKSQGSEWPTIIILFPPSTFSTSVGFVNRKMIYTAITRAKKRLVLVGDMSVFEFGASTKDRKRYSLKF